MSDWSPMGIQNARVFSILQWGLIQKPFQNKALENSCAGNTHFSHAHAHIDAHTHTYTRAHTHKYTL